MSHPSAITGSPPVFQHAEGDQQSFRPIAGQLIDMGAARPVDVVKAFGVPLHTRSMLCAHGLDPLPATPEAVAAYIAECAGRLKVGALRGD